ncbi:hypothetical protein ZWY2020_053540 [Hordeum vulgare]|nr:hypothetical protein ZWY2020_053532 [Hordeum vulgare]KAI4998198.1 hypothetical protein ZWY2020_053540 [Hordeum vulgare]
MPVGLLAFRLRTSPPYRLIAPTSVSLRSAACSSPTHASTQSTAVPSSATTGEHPLFGCACISSPSWLLRSRAIGSFSTYAGSVCASTRWPAARSDRSFVRAPRCRLLRLLPPPAMPSRALAGCRPTSGSRGRLRPGRLPAGHLWSKALTRPQPAPAAPMANCPWERSKEWAD